MFGITHGEPEREPNRNLLVAHAEEGDKIQAVSIRLLTRQERKILKKIKSKATDELRTEYKRSDFDNLVRGKYAARVAAETNIVVLEPDVAKAFPNDSAVNEALRGLLEVPTRTARVAQRSTGRAKQRRAS